MILNINYFFASLVQCFFIVVLLELFLLGSGQILSIEGLSLRMLLYSVAVLASFFVLCKGIKINEQVFIFLITYVAMLVFSTSIGILNNANPTKIVENLKPLIFALMVVPFYFFIQNIQRVNLIVKLIKFSGLLMAFGLLLLLFLLFKSYIDFDTIYVLLSSDANDLMMNDGRIARIFYKGFLYLNIAFIFYFYSNSKYKFIFLMLLALAVFLTFTRGFVLALILAFILMSILEINNKKSFMFLILIGLVTLIVAPFYNSIIGDREVSDSIRFLQIQEVFDAITLPSLFFGHGFGIGVPIRPDGMEITYLEIFHKQGIMGLVLWVGFLVYMLYGYLKIRIIEYREILKPFVVSTIFVYMQSLTNPYLNNPIGMSMVLISFVVFILISEMDKNTGSSI